MATEYDLGSVLGPQGAKGEQGVSITNTQIGSNGDLIVTLSNGSIINAGSTIGPQGPKGETGQSGKSAYEQAKEGGYSGTEAQFIVELNSIAGKADKSYVDTALPGKATGNPATGDALNAEKLGGELPERYAKTYPPMLWKPTLYGWTVAGEFTYSAQIGSCVVIGNTATIFAKIEITNVAQAPRGTYRISGCPVTSKYTEVPLSIAIGTGGKDNSMRKLMGATIYGKTILPFIYTETIEQAGDITTPIETGVQSQSILIEVGGTFEIA